MSDTTRGSDSLKHLRIVTGRSNPQLAEEVAGILGVSLTDAGLVGFASSELKCKLGESVRDCDVFIFQSHDDPVSEALVEQLLLVDAAKRASARTVTVVAPFYPFARQDKKSDGREPISARLVADLFTAAGATRLVSVDLHAGQIQGYFDGPFDHLIAMPVLLKWIHDNLPDDIVMVSPDAGRVKVTERFTQKLKVPMAIVYKTRDPKKQNEAEAHAVLGDVDGRHCVIVDDMIDTAGTIVKACNVIKAAGAATITVMTTHGVFSDQAIKRLADAPIEQVVTTDTLDQTRRPGLEKMTVLKIAPLLARAVDAIYTGRSVSELFDGDNQI